VFTVAGLQFTVGGFYIFKINYPEP